MIQAGCHWLLAARICTALDSKWAAANKHAKMLFFIALADRASSRKSSEKKNNLLAKAY